MTGGRGLLLAVIEYGGYPNFAPLYQKLGFTVRIERSVRKALAAIREAVPAAIVAEFNFQSDFRDRTSSLESLLAAVDRHPEIPVVVFFDPQHGPPLERLRARFPRIRTVSYPIDPGALERALSSS
jgi:hypothetical protein